MDSSDDLSTFVRAHVRSVWDLELLLLLRADPTRCWLQADLVRELRASQMVVAEGLRRLSEAGLAMRDEALSWCFQPANPSLAQLCADLEVAYRERPVRIINMIAKPSPLQSLADAFKFRNDGKA